MSIVWQGSQGERKGIRHVGVPSSAGDGARSLVVEAPKALGVAAVCSASPSDRQLSHSPHARDRECVSRHCEECELRSNPAFIVTARSIASRTLAMTW